MIGARLAPAELVPPRRLPLLLDDDLGVGERAPELLARGL
jgi:hypothetical protein